MYCFSVWLVLEGALGVFSSLFAGVGFTLDCGSILCGIGLCACLHRVCIGFASGLHRVCIGFASGLHRVCIGFASGLHRVCIGFA